MLKNYLKLAWRNLTKNKSFSAINIVGLSIGLTCCILITLYVQHELSYDKFQANGKKIARVIMEYSIGGAMSKGNYTSTKVAPAFKQNFPEVVSAVRMSKSSKIIRHGEKNFMEKRFMYADSTFFKLFSFRVLRGNPATALSGPNVVLLTKSTAEKYFGKTNPVGNTLTVGIDAVPYHVTGVIEDCPSNSHIKFDFLASFSSLAVSQERTYWEANYTTYLLLNEESSINTLQAKIPGFMKKEMASEFQGNDYLTYELEPFNKIHLYSKYDGFEPNNSIVYIYIISAVALLILFIACFTYVNLSTARSIERAKEVGIRKVSGAHKNNIFWQFINESFVLSLIALGISIACVYLLLPAFNELAERELQISHLFQPVVFISVVVILACISLLAGSYPALVLSRFEPVKVLKGAFKNSGRGLWLRKSLIVFQFAISIFLIVSTFIIQSQLHFIQNKKLGYDRDHVLVLPFDQKVRSVLNSLKSEAKSNPDVLSISRSAQAPSNIVGGYTMKSPDITGENTISVNANPVDEDFVKTMGLKVIAGNDLTKQDMDNVSHADFEKRYYAYILNESAAKVLGWTAQEAVGKRLFLGDSRPGIVKGVIKDFHFSSLHNPIKPLVLFPDTWSNMVLVKVSGQHLPGTISFLEKKWKTLVTHRPFDFHFLDEDYNKLYSAELRIGKVLNVFASIAMILACLGLFGLSAYTIQQRTKEIGIRKILGATTAKIVLLVSNDFIRLVIIAFALAAPVAWYAGHEWLQDFVYRISISGWVFVIVGISTLLIAILTVSVHAIKTAFLNPARSLRTE